MLNFTMNSKANLDTLINLNDGTKIPLFGLGLYLAEPGKSAQHATEFALKHGYRLFDTAQYYQNEEDVGAAVRNCGIPREELYIVSKVFDTNHGYNETIKSVEESIKKFGLDYIDVFLIHSPNRGKNVDTYKALLEFKAKGIIRSVGVSNFGIPHLKGLEAAGLPKPSINQLEMQPFKKEWEIVKYCREQNIAVMGYCPVARGERNDNPNLMTMSQKYNKTVPQVMLRWAIDNNFITIPKSTNEQRIIENSQIFDFTLTPEEHEIIDGLPNDFECGWDPTKTEWLG